jgi:hypothetical protein
VLDNQLSSFFRAVFREFICNAIADENGRLTFARGFNGTLGLCRALSHLEEHIDWRRNPRVTRYYMF